MKKSEEVYLNIKKGLIAASLSGISGPFLGGLPHFSFVKLYFHYRSN